MAESSKGWQALTLLAFPKTRQAVGSNQPSLPFLLPTTWHVLPEIYILLWSLLKIFGHDSQSQSLPSSLESAAGTLSRGHCGINSKGSGLSKPQAANLCPRTSCILENSGGPQNLAYYPPRR